MFHQLNNFLKSNDKINEEWNAIGVISNNSSTVGAYDLDLISSENNRNSTFDKIQNNANELLFLFGQDDLKFTKKMSMLYILVHMEIKVQKCQT